MWYYASRGAAVGPVNDQKARGLIHDGAITQETLVWQEGATKWLQAKDTELGRFWRGQPTVAPPAPVARASPLLLPPVTSQAAPHRFRDPAPLSTLVTWLLIGNLMLAIVGMWSSLLQLEVLNRSARGGTVTTEEANVNDDRVSIIGFVQLGIYIVTIVVFGRWIYVAAKNIRRLGAAGLEFSPGWAVGYYFVPILNLWKPYQAMKEIWKASHAPTAWRDHRGGVLLVLWWTFWILSNVAGRVVISASMGASSVSDFITVTNMNIVAQIIDIPLCLVAILLVRTISRTQLKTATGRA